MSLTNFAFKEEYKYLANLGDKLSEIEYLIDWKPFRPIIAGSHCEYRKCSVSNYCKLKKTGKFLVVLESAKIQKQLRTRFF